jgi:geranylgeranyl reductase family protein
VKTDGHFDLIVVGGGPSGAACAAFCAQAGMRVAILERARFPREKVCGDCLNPFAWPVLERLGVGQAVRAEPHTPLDRVELIGANQRRLTFALPKSDAGEIAIRRSILDDLLLRRAQQLGAEVHEDSAVASLSSASAKWKIRTADREFFAPRLVAADGRNSTVARLLGLLPQAARDRVAWQTHVPLPGDLARAVEMRFHAAGYSGLADVGKGLANLCLVARPKRIEELKTWAQDRFALAPGHRWQTITPLSRATVHPEHPGLFLVGDAARVVEPFTGEGIAYALASGELAARHLLKDRPGYADANRRLYAGRLWVNRLARWACLYPRAGSLLLHAPALIGWLTRKVIRPDAPTVSAQTPALPPPPR